MTLAEQLESAKHSLAEVREEFKDDPDMLEVYEPSAVWLVNQLSREE